MDWMEVTVRTTTAGVDLVSELLMRAGASGTSIEDRNDAGLDLPGHMRWDILDQSVVDAMDADAIVRGYLPADAAALERVAALRETLAALTDGLGFDAGPLTLTVENVREEDWAENWKKYYKPFRVGERIIIKPEWEPVDERPGDLVIEIDPGMAFGNGTHETTAMCLSLIEAWMEPGDTVLDVGTGSGILSIAAAKLGAKRVTAIDLDPLAVRVAKENIDRNGLGEVVSARVGDLLQGIDGAADFVVANIIADAVILLSEAVRAHMAPGGLFLSSGIIRDREADVQRALLEAGFAVLHTERRGEWVAIVARR